MTPRIEWTQHGQTGPPVLLIMGLTMPGQVWRPQLHGLRDSHRLITYDHRGLGGSDGSQDWYEIADLAQDAIRVLDEAQWPSAHVVGVSMGGMIAQEVALATPERLRSLTLIATHGGGRTAWVPGMRGLRGFVAAASKDRNRRTRGLERMLYPPQWLDAQERPEFLASLEDRLNFRAPRSTALRQLRAVFRHRALARLSAVSAPTLVVQAGRDVLIDPSNSDRLYTSLPNAKLLRFPDAGHGIIHQEAEALNQALRDHFATCESRWSGRSRVALRD